jgi:hypothetical protein
MVAAIIITKLLVGPPFTTSHAGRPWTAHHLSLFYGDYNVTCVQTVKTLTEIRNF